MNYFIDYWDDVIRLWLNKSIECQQQLFLNEKKLNLSEMDMPEPYWGNPHKCSIVIANYNPGGGADRSRHTYREYANCPDSFINQVKQNGYSQVALDFPIINDPDNKERTFCWWKEYGGRKWWLNKMKWLDEIEQAIPHYKESTHKPFAIEFCGWHSTNWPQNACCSLYDNSAIKPVIDKYFIKPLADAVHNSDTHLGLCVGSQFFHLFDKMCKTDPCVKHICKYPLSTKAPHNIHLFKIHGENIIVIWGKGFNRYPKGIEAAINNIIKHISTNKEETENPVKE